MEFRVEESGGGGGGEEGKWRREKERNMEMRGIEMEKREVREERAIMAVMISLKLLLLLSFGGKIPKR